MFCLNNARSLVRLLQQHAWLSGEFSCVHVAFGANEKLQLIGNWAVNVSASQYSTDQTPIATATTQTQTHTREYESVGVETRKVIEVGAVSFGGSADYCKYLRRQKQPDPLRRQRIGADEATNAAQRQQQQRLESNAQQHR